MGNSVQSGRRIRRLGMSREAAEGREVAESGSALGTTLALVLGATLALDLGLVLGLGERATDSKAGFCSLNCQANCEQGRWYME